MKIILGIIIFYIVAIVCARHVDGKNVLYILIAFISLLLAGFVVLMMFMMPEPKYIM
jgi:hypothetical protein